MPKNWQTRWPHWLSQGCAKRNTVWARSTWVNTYGHWLIIKIIFLTWFLFAIENQIRCELSWDMFNKGDYCCYRCHPWTGRCECVVGWDGAQCARPCPLYTFGLGCRSPCTCQNNAQCLPNNGTCICAQGNIHYFILKYLIHVLFVITFSYYLFLYEII